MNEKEFNKIFGHLKDYDTITIGDLREILIVPEEVDPKVEKFLDTRIKNYDFDNSTKQNRQLGAMIRNRFDCETTFRSILESGYFPEKMIMERGVGHGIVNQLMHIYMDNGVTDIWKYRKGI